MTQERIARLHEVITTVHRFANELEDAIADLDVEYIEWFEAVIRPLVDRVSHLVGDIDIAADARCALARKAAEND